MKLDKAFPGMPASFEDAMREGIRKGKQKMKLKNKIKIASVAAALTLCVLAAAFAAGNGVAPDDTVTASPTPDISVKTVYITQHGAFYHSKPDCQGMQNAVTVSESEAIEQGKRRCPVCMSGEAVYATQRSVYYHADPNCSGMQNASAMSESEAESMGKRPCPTCLPGKAADLHGYEEATEDILDTVFPGASEAYKQHYNVRFFELNAVNGPDVRCSFYPQNSAIELGSVTFEAGSLNDWTLALNFADTEIAYKIVEGCAKENHVSECISEVEKLCRTDLLTKLTSSVQESFSAHSGKYGLHSDLNSAKKELSAVTVRYADSVGYEALTIEFKDYSDRVWLHFDLYDYELSGVTLIDLQMNGDW